MTSLVFLLSLLGASVLAQTNCPAVTGGPKYAAPIVAKGFTARVVISGLTRPRGMVFDTEGNMLVMQNRKEITAFRMSNDGGCVKVTGKSTVLDAAIAPGEAVGLTYSSLWSIIKNGNS
jgi:glucose/arabinose dehydrogenase